MDPFTVLLAKEFSLRPEQVQAVITLLDAGNTIPFIARYRKEATGSLDDQLLRELANRLEYLRNLDKRRMEIEKAMEELKNSVSSPKYVKTVDEEILKAKALQGEIYSNAAKNMKKEQ